MQNIGKIKTGLLVGILTLLMGVAQSYAGENEKILRVSYPTNVAPGRASIMASKLGEPTNNSCDTLAKDFGLDPDTIMIAHNNNGESGCYLEDVKTLQN